MPMSDVKHATVRAIYKLKYPHEPVPSGSPGWVAACGAELELDDLDSFAVQDAKALIAKELVALPTCPICAAKVVKALADGRVVN